MSAIEEAREALAKWDRSSFPDVGYAYLAESLRALIAEVERLSAPPSDDEREVQAQAALDSERLRQIAEWLRMDHGHEETAKRVDLIADRHDRLAAGFRRQGPITDEAVDAARDAAYRALFGPEGPSSAWDVAYRCARAALEAAERVRSAVPSTAEPNDQWVTAPDGEVWRAGACQGHDTCPVETHEHGCFADVGNCDHPEEHEPTEQEQP